MSLGLSRALKSSEYNDLLCSLTEFMTINYNEY